MATTRRTAPRGANSSAAKGAQAEALLAGYHLCARQHGIAQLWRTQAPAKHIGEGRVVFEGPGVTDFLGLMLDGTGRLVAEEVKALGWGQERLSLSQVKEHQRACLEATLAGGGVAVLTVVRPYGVVSVVPWAEARRVRGLGPNELDAWRVHAASYLRSFVRSPGRP